MSAESLRPSPSPEPTFFPLSASGGICSLVTVCQLLHRQQRREYRIPNRHVRLYGLQVMAQSPKRWQGRAAQTARRCIPFQKRGPGGWCDVAHLQAVVKHGSAGQREHQSRSRYRSLRASLASWRQKPSRVRVFSLQATCRPCICVESARRRILGQGRFSELPC